MRSEVEAPLALLFRVPLTSAEASGSWTTSGTTPTDPSARTSTRCSVCTWTTFRTGGRSPRFLSVAHRGFTYGSLASWRRQLDQGVDFIFALCDDIESGKTKLHFDPAALNPRLFLDSQARLLHMARPSTVPPLRLCQREGGVRVPAADQKGASRHHPAGLSVSNAIWNENTQQLQDIRMQLDTTPSSQRRDRTTGTKSSAADCSRPSESSPRARRSRCQRWTFRPT